MPSLRKVPTMLASGWGGINRVNQCEAFVCDSASEYLEVPVFLRRAANIEPQSSIMFSRVPPRVAIELIRERTTPEEFIDQCHSFFSSRWLTKKFSIDLLEDLLEANLPDRVLEELEAIQALSTAGNAEQQVVVGFFIILMNSPVGGYFNAKEKKAIEKADRDVVISSEIQNALELLFGELCHDDWGFSVEWLEEVND